MIFDKNEKRIKELEKKADQRFAARIAELKARPPEWWIQYRDATGRVLKCKCPIEYQSVHGAKKFHAIRISEITRGVADAPNVRHVRLSEVLDAYLNEHMVGKKSYKAARTICEHIKRHIGDWWLDKIDQKPALLVDFFRDFPEKHWAQKYVWNYYINLRAAINYWIRFRRLHMLNPCNVVQVEQNTAVMDYVPTEADLQAILHASLIEGLPDWVRHLFVVVYETGLRIGEVLSMSLADIRLTPEDGGLPYYFVYISKQKRRTKIAVPMSQRCFEAMNRQVAGRTMGTLFPVKTPPHYILYIDQEQPDGTKVTRHLLEIAGVSHKFRRPFHDFRKSAKLTFRSLGGKEISMAMMGHATSSMDDYYTHYQRKDLEIAVAKTWKKAEPCRTNRINRINGNNGNNGDAQNDAQNEKGESFDSP